MPSFAIGRCEPTLEFCLTGRLPRASSPSPQIKVRAAAVAGLGSLRGELAAPVAAPLICHGLVPAAAVRGVVSATSTKLRVLRKMRKRRGNQSLGGGTKGSGTTLRSPASKGSSGGGGGGGGGGSVSPMSRGGGTSQGASGPGGLGDDGVSLYDDEEEDDNDDEYGDEDGGGSLGGGGGACSNEDELPGDAATVGPGAAGGGGVPRGAGGASVAEVSVYSDEEVEEAPEEMLKMGTPLVSAGTR